MFQRIFCWNIRADIRISNNREIWDVDKTKHLCNLHSSSSVEVLYLTDRLQTTEVLVQPVCLYGVNTRQIKQLLDILFSCLLQSLDKMSCLDI